LQVAGRFEDSLGSVYKTESLHRQSPIPFAGRSLFERDGTGDSILGVLVGFVVARAGASCEEARQRILKAAVGEMGD
jgi:hypothetical protein